MIKNQHVYAVLLAGGGGTRLWPKSRNKHPKQFLKLTGTETMIQQTAARLAKLLPPERIIVVTNKLYQKDICEQLPEVPEENIIAEPQKKDTAIAMLVGALYAKAKDPKAVVMNVASDHILTDEQEYFRVMKAAVKVAADENYLVTIGITPTFPHTGFGYIKAGEDLKKINHRLSLFKVNSFTEKPNRPTALGYISTGKYFWNANMYVWSAASISKAFEKHMPEMYKLAKDLYKKNPKEFHQALPAIYNQVEKMSVDYAISEKANNLVLIPGDFGWDDVGSWKVVYNLGKKDINGNVIIGDTDEVNAVVINSQKNLIHANKRLVALLGVNDMVVVDTDEIVLIAPKDRSQEVKKIVNRLKEEKKDEYI
ncbi:MAG: mannose-1-phosphate guanylyltransferase [Patescibacteria group bacterium]|nr:mannose-1-phosphate guanylyltransferase [Patescibacteria group bacterium]